MSVLQAVFVSEMAKDVRYMEPIALVKCDTTSEAEAQIKEAIGLFPGLLFHAVPMTDLGQWMIGAFVKLRIEAERDGIAWCTEGYEDAVLNGGT